MLTPRLFCQIKEDIFLSNPLGMVPPLKIVCVSTVDEVP